MVALHYLCDPSLTFLVKVSWTNTPIQLPVMGCSINHQTHIEWVYIQVILLYNQAIRHFIIDKCSITNAEKLHFIYSIFKDFNLIKRNYMEMLSY